MAYNEAINGQHSLNCRLAITLRNDRVTCVNGVREMSGTMNRRVPFSRDEFRIKPKARG